MKKLFTFFCALFFAVPAWSGPTFNLYAPANGVQKNTGFTYQNTAAGAADIAGTYTGQTGCSGSAALLFNAQCSIIPTVPLAANPSGLIGLAAVNGSAGTWERSDATHALNQGIAPTWTGYHIFSVGSETFGAVNPSIGQTGVYLSSRGSLGIIDLVNAAGGTNAKGIAMYADSGGNFNIGTSNDTFTSGDSILSSNRSGVSITSISLGNGIDKSSITLNGPVTIPAPAGTNIAESVQSASSAIGINIKSGGISSNDNPLLIQTNGGANLLQIRGDGNIFAAGLISSTAAQTGTLCWSSSFGLITYDPTNTCLASSIRYKKNITPLNEGLSAVMRLRPVSYQLKDEFNPAHLGPQIGFIAEDVQKIDPRLTPLDDKGLPRSVEYMQITALLAKGEQDLQREILGLRATVAFLFGWCTLLTVLVMLRRRHG